MANDTAKAAAQKKIQAILNPIAEKLEAEIASGALAGCQVELSYDASNVNENYDLPHLAPHLSGYSNEIRLLCHEPDSSKGSETFFETIAALPEEGTMPNGVKLEYDDDTAFVQDTPFEPREDELEVRYVPSVAVVYITASVAADED